MKSGQTETRAQPLGLAAALALLLSAGCATQRIAPELPSTGTSRPQLPSYALVVDASSSGSRLHIFQWRANEPGDLPEVKAAPSAAGSDEEAWQLAVDGGLSDYAGDPDQAGESLDPLLSFAREKLTAAGADLAATTLHLKATGGMRLVPEPERGAIMDDVRRSLAASGFDFRKAEVITGQQEGLFGWISVNYLLGQLGHGPFPTVGALDLGGASTQITFVPIDFSTLR